MTYAAPFMWGCKTPPIPRVWFVANMAGGSGPRGGSGKGRRGHGGRGGRGFPGGWAGPWFGPPGARGPRGGWRAGRGDVRNAVLLLLDEQPRHGYDIITEISARSGGQWRPSPGSVYPVLARLESRGLVTAEEISGRKVFDLTASGRTFVAENRAEMGEPWVVQSTEPDAEVLADLMQTAKETAMAVWQVGQAGDDTQLAEAVEILAETRRRLYDVLGRKQGNPGDDEPDGTT